jgi:hypothetical protein
VLDAVRTLDHEFHQFRREIMATLADLQAVVAKQTTVDDSVIALLQGIKAKLDAAIAANDPAALQALSDSLTSEQTKLTDAVSANTPAA